MSDPQPTSCSRPATKAEVGNFLINSISSEDWFPFEPRLIIHSPLLTAKRAKRYLSSKPIDPKKRYISTSICFRRLRHKCCYFQNGQQIKEGLRCLCLKSTSQQRLKNYWSLDSKHVAGLASMTPIKRGPFQIDSHEDRARRPCRSPVALQGLSGIGIPSRKTQARHSGQLCSIRGKSGGARPGGEPYRRIGQTSGQLASRRALRVAEAWRFFFSSPFSPIRGGEHF